MNELGRHRKNDYWKDETLGMKQYDAVQCRPDHDKPEIGSRLTFICEARAIYRRSIYIDVSTLVRACVLGTVSRFKISQADFLVDSLLERTASPKLLDKSARHRKFSFRVADIHPPPVATSWVPPLSMKRMTDVVPEE